MPHPTLSSSDVIAPLLEKTLALGADSADAVMFESSDINVQCRLSKQEGLERSETRAVGLRAFFGKQQAIASSTDCTPGGLSELAERAAAMAKVAPPDPDSGLAPPGLWLKSLPELDLFDNDEPSPDWLYGRCQEAEEAALAVSGISNSEGAEAYYGKNRITLGIQNKENHFLKSYDTSRLSLSVSVLAGSGTAMERDYDFTSARHRSDLSDAASLGREAARRAKARLNPRKIKTSKLPIIFDPRVSRNALSILASAISGSAITRGASFLKDSLGKSIFASSISIVDDPFILRGLSSRPFDGEGIQGQKLTLIEKGVLKSWLLDMRSANRLKLATTGHASRGIASSPSPSATNLYMEKGKLSPQSLMNDIKEGLYITETFGMGVNTITGDYSQGAAGFWIENGEITYPVSEITIAGKLADMFKNVTPANDLEFRYATNAPTLRVEEMTVAGS